MKLFLNLALTLLFAVILLGLPAQAGWDANAELKAEATVAAFKETDPSMQAFFDQAYGYAVFPTVGKGAMGIGGAYGEGIVYQEGKSIGTATLTQVTVGLQLGGQVYSEIIFFKDESALNDFINGLKLAAQASAVAATAGAAANADYAEGVAVFTMAQGGLMYEASIGGQEFTFQPKEGP